MRPDAKTIHLLSRGGKPSHPKQKVLNFPAVPLFPGGSIYASVLRRDVSGHGRHSLFLQERGSAAATTRRLSAPATLRPTAATAVRRTAGGSRGGSGPCRCSAPCRRSGPRGSPRGCSGSRCPSRRTDVTAVADGVSVHGRRSVLDASLQHAVR